MDELHLEFPFTGARMLQGLLERTGGGSIGRRSSTCDPIPTWYGWIGCTCRSCVPSPDAEKFNSAGATEAGVDYCRQCRHTLGHLEKFFSPSRHESDSMIVRGHGRMERAGHGAEGLFRC